MRLINSPIDPAAVIYVIRGEKVILDADLARIYGVSTSHFNQAIRRNSHRFPTDFRFQLTRAELEQVKSERGIGPKGGAQKLPWAFNEHGAVMAANVLHSETAIQMSVFVVRAFLKMRNALSDTTVLAAKLKKLEREVTARLNSHEKAIVELMQQFLSIINPEPTEPSPEMAKREIGFHVKDKKDGTGAMSKRVR